MKITEHTPKVLKFKKENSELGCLPFTITILVLLIGLGIILFRGQKTTLNCRRIEPTRITCELTPSGFLSKNISTIKQPRRAELEPSESSNGDINYTLILITRSERIPLTNLSPSQKNIDKINTFIKKTEDQLLTIQKIRWPTYIRGGLLMLTGGFFTLAGASIKELTLCTFDKSSDQLCLEYQNMLSQSDIREVKLDAIKIAEVDEIIESDEDEDKDENHVKRTYVKRYDVKLVLKSDTTIPLFSTNLDKEYSFEVITTINEFLGIDSKQESSSGLQ